MAKSKKASNGNGANLGFEEKLWAAADKLRGHMDAAEYKHVVLGLVFLKYISDAFQELHDALASDKNSDPEDRDEYLAENVFWVPKVARWAKLQASAKQPPIGKLIDDAMAAIEKDNPTLKGVLPKDYGRASLDKQRLGELIDLIGTIGLGDAESRGKDVLGRVYEFFLGKFANAEGKGGGEFYTPQSVVKLLVEMIEPYKGRIYDPCCGSGGMFVSSEKFVVAHGGRVGDLSIYGQESNNTTWRLSKMNLAIRGIDGNIGPHNADTFHNDLHKDLKADFILANPPFNISDWGGERTHRELSEVEIARIAKTYHAWRGEKDAGKYADIAGFCKSASREEIESHGHVLTPGRYVGAEETEDDDDMPFDERMRQLTAKLKGQFAESAKLEKAILKNLASLGFTGKESS